jgi:hypothetical protein
LSSASGGSRSIEVPKGGSGSYSVFVYDNTYATSTTCTFKVDGLVKKPATSNDGGKRILLLVQLDLGSGMPGQCAS